MKLVNGTISDAKTSKSLTQLSYYEPKKSSVISDGLERIHFKIFHKHVRKIVGLENKDDKIYGSAGTDIIYGRSGNDILNGRSGNDILYGGNGNDTIYGQKGNDYLNGGNGNDILDGGTGKDVLKGGRGDDTYIWGKGSGHDLICSYEESDGVNMNGTDTIQFGEGITAESLDYKQFGQNLIIKIKSTGETLTLNNWFKGEFYQVDKYLFADGTELSVADITSLLEKETSHGSNYNYLDGSVSNSSQYTCSGGQYDSTCQMYSQIDQLVQAMATSSSDKGMSLTEGLEQKQDSMQNILAAYWNPSHLTSGKQYRL